MKATVIAHSNLALVKYWGKRDIMLNLPATGSISITLKELFTQTTVHFKRELNQDKLILNGQKAGKQEQIRVNRFLDLIRNRFGAAHFAEVNSNNNYPTGAGLASSASGFAALTLAATKALNLDLSKSQLSELARQGSGSAARSIFGSFVEMNHGIQEDGSDAVACQILDQESWPLEVIVAVTTEKAKPIGSSEGMELTRNSSPYYKNWIDTSADDLEKMRSAIQERNFTKLGEITEHSCLKMHALMFSSKPGIFYWNPVTVAVINTVKDLREKGIEAFFTIDAGPQVKIICQPENSEIVENTIGKITGIQKIIRTGLGPGAKVIGN